MANTVKIKQNEVTLHPVTNTDAVIYDNATQTTLTSKLNSINVDISNVEDNLSNLDDRFQSLTDDVRSNESSINNLEGNFTSLETTVDANTNDIANLDNSLHEVSDHFYESNSDIVINSDYVLRLISGEGIELNANDTYVTLTPERLQKLIKLFSVLTASSSGGTRIDDTSDLTLGGGDYIDINVSDTTLRLDEAKLNKLIQLLS